MSKKVDLPRMDVVCPNCGEIFYEANAKQVWDRIPWGDTLYPVRNPTRAAYDPDKPANGAMFRMKEKWASQGWPPFPYDETVQFEQLECPACGMSLADSRGRVKILEIVSLDIDDAFHEHVTVDDGDTLISAA